jgi:hypothetical protein
MENRPGLLQPKIVESELGRFTAGFICVCSQKRVRLWSAATWRRFGSLAPPPLVAKDYQSGDKSPHSIPVHATEKRCKTALQTRIAGLDGVLQVYVDVLPEEVRVVSILDRDAFDGALENQIYDIHYDVLEEFDLPMRFFCLPRTALQTVSHDSSLRLFDRSHTPEKG